MYPMHLISGKGDGEISKSLELPNLDPLLNARDETVLWIQEHIPC